MTLRVVHVVRSDSFAGVERYICDVAGPLIELGCQVEVVGGDPVRMRAELPSGVVHRAAATTGEAFRNLLRGPRADLLHAHMTAAELAAVLAGGLRRTPVVSTRHFAAPRGSSATASLIGRAVARRLVRQISISHFVATRVGEPTLVLHNAVPGAPASRLGPQVLVLQRLEAEKDTATAVRAWAMCRARSQGWTLTIAGRGSEADGLRSLAEDLNVADSVHFAGFVTDPGELRQAAGLLLATAPEEPFGLAVVEAMAAGLPVVAAAGGAHLETLAEVGAFFPPGDSRACAVQLDRLALDAGLRHDLARRARARQQVAFALPAHAGGLMRVYRDVVAREP